MPRKTFRSGPGRGSAAGSLVGYAMGITDIDPLQYGLLFERFLNPERISLPDIDIDFCMNRRGEVIQYVTEKYGREQVAQIITFNTMATRAANLISTAVLRRHLETMLRLDIESTSCPARAKSSISTSGIRLSAAQANRRPLLRDRRQEQRSGDYWNKWFQDN